ncbi:MAG: serine/threonine-protein kinase, partial [Pyrinomonadaceae bacterium]|nr:serine/threonine-protein kinase [Pyrinomonadaceae bacterium]
VAMKFLPAEVAKDTLARSRFEREAQTASALNHPNILTVFEIGETNETRYIATEYIAGETLRMRLSRKESILLTTVLNIGIQISEALIAAHEAGIIHRDIKPENLMIRKDGYVKILDFGLAKLIERDRPDEVSLEAGTKPFVETNPGIVMGTVSYMSPEQAQAKETDARTDIWSLGVVLYEMLAGFLPFEGETSMEMIAAIINKEPKPLNNSSVPPEIQTIISKSLRRNKNERYQTIKGLMADLKEVRRELEFQDKLEKTIEPASSVQPTEIRDAATIDEQKQSTNITAESKNPAWKYGIGIVGLLAVVFIAGLYFLSGNFFSEKRIPFAQFNTKELTSGNGLSNPILSPDGKLVAYSKTGQDHQTGKGFIVVRQVESGAENVIYEVDNTAGIGTRTQTFSPDGEYIYFVKRSSDSSSDLYRIPTLGGNPQKIMEGKITDVSISPDGKRISYRRYEGIYTSMARGSAYIADIDGSNQQEILNLEDIESIFLGLGNWSPDGTKLSLIFPRDEDGSGNTGLFDITDLTRNRKERLELVHNELWTWADEPLWTPDGEGLILTAARLETPGKRDIWHISYPQGKLSRITDDTNSYGIVSIAADGKTMVTVASIQPTSLWSVDPNTKNVRQMKGENKTVYGFSMSRATDGRLYFLKSQLNNTAVFSMNEDGGDEKELFKTSKYSSHMTVSPDGKFIVATIFSIETASRRIYRINPDGSNQVELTQLKTGVDRNPQATVDGMILFDRKFYSSDAPSVIMKVPLAGGKTENIEGLEASDGDSKARLSHDGKLLAYVAEINDKTSSKSKIYIRVVEFADGRAGKMILEKEMVTMVDRLRWTLESNALIYERNENHHNLFKLQLSNQQETQISSFDLNTNTGDFVWSEDGKRILVFKVSRIDNLVLLKDIYRN